jgi:uncharacterized protein YkwD
MRRVRTSVAVATVLVAVLVMPASGQGDGLQRLLAPTASCAGQGNARAPIGVQERAMLCLTNFARHRAGLPRLSDDRDLTRSAGHKSHDILRCDQFEHQACGLEFTHWMTTTGYIRGPCWRVGENLAMGHGAGATPRAIFDALLHSEPHRHNILGEYRDLGVGLRIGTFGGERGVRVWTQHFGEHC